MALRPRAARAGRNIRSGGGAGFIHPGVSAASLSPATIAENAAPGTVVGTLSATPSDSNFILRDSAGNRFALVGDQIVAGAVATNFEAASEHQIVVRAEYAGAYEDTTLTITVTNVTEISDIALSASTIESGAAEDTVVGALTSTPAGAAWTLVDDAGGRFKLVGSNIVAGATPTDFGTDESHDIVVRGTRQGEAREETFTVTVTEPV